MPGLREAITVSLGVASEVTDLVKTEVNIETLKNFLVNIPRNA